MPGSRFKEFIDRAFLGNRGYNYQTGEWNRSGVTSGLIGGIGNAIVPGLGTVGRKVYEHYHPPGTGGTTPPTQTNLDGGTGGWQPWSGGIDNTIPGINTGYDVDGGGLNSGGGYQPYTGGVNGSFPPIQTGTDGGMTPGQVPLDTSGGYGYQGWSGGIDHNIPGIRTGGSTGGGHTTNGGGGLYTSGTLGGGTAVDPSQWGAYGLGGDGGPDNGGIGQGYALQLMSGGMHEGGGSGGQGAGVLAGLLAGRRTPATGGGLAPQSLPVRTGGGLPPYMRPPVKPGGGGQIGG